MKPRVAILVLLVAAVAWLGLGSCTDPGGRANVRVVVQGASQVDNVVDVVLWAHPTGTSYDFDVAGDAIVDHADFTLDVTYVGDGEPTHSVDFSLPLAAVDAQDGEHGEGHQRCDIYPGDNWCYIPFGWTANPPPAGDTNVILQFSHPPRIIVWSKVPGPGVAAGTTISIQAEVVFYGDGTADSVTVQFWDNEAAGGSFVGDVGSLTYNGVRGLWIGTITAVAGADTLFLTAQDSDGATSSQASYAVPGP